MSDDALLLPSAAPDACALLIHEFPEGSNALAILGHALADSGYAVRSFAAPTDGAALAEAADDLRRRTGRPLLAVGHGTGGRHLVAALARIEPPAALALINSPCACEEFADASRHHRLPLLILHAPLDALVPIDQAGALFAAAKHPKSFISLDGADHLLTQPIEAHHAAASLIGWAARYLRRPPQAHEVHQVVVEESGDGRYRQRVSAGRHRLIADEPLAAGGDDAGPAPYDLLLAALGACTSMTLRMYAELKQLPLHHVRVTLRHEKVHAADCAECETREGRIDRIERDIALEGDLTPEQRQRLLEIANKCPVHRTLHSEVWVATRLEGAS